MKGCVKGVKNARPPLSALSSPSFGRASQRSDSDRFRETAAVFSAAHRLRRCLVPPRAPVTLPRPEKSVSHAQSCSPSQQQTVDPGRGAIAHPKHPSASLGSPVDQRVISDRIYHLPLVISRLSSIPVSPLTPARRRHDTNSPLAEVAEIQSCLHQPERRCQITGLPCHPFAIACHTCHHNTLTPLTNRRQRERTREKPEGPLPLPLMRLAIISLTSKRHSSPSPLLATHIISAAE